MAAFGAELPRAVCICISNLLNLRISFYQFHNLEGKHLRSQKQALIRDNAAEALLPLWYLPCTYFFLLSTSAR